MKIKLPEKVKFILQTLSEAGFEAYAVGGCVRDSILGRKPQDWDVTTSALTHEVKALFSRTIDTGLEHGTVTVMFEKEGFEVTTYRIDGEYEDARHPKTVQFTLDVTKDLERRDFTMNAMAYNEEHGLIDVFEGMKDLKEGRIRCVGNPMERFLEDALRMLRAVRFAAQLGFTIEEETLFAMKQLAPNLKKISAERIQVELLKLVTSDHPSYLRIAYETGITKMVLPEFDEMMELSQTNIHHCYNVGEHSLKAMEEIGADKVLRLTMLFHDIGKPATSCIDANGVQHFYGHGEKGAQITKDILFRLKFDNETKNQVVALVKWHDYSWECNLRSTRKAMAKLGDQVFARLFEVKRADNCAKCEDGKVEILNQIKDYEVLYHEILDRGDCLSLKELAVNGEDLISFGVPKGKKIGETLQYLLTFVVEHPDKNTRDDLLYVLEKR